MFVLEVITGPYRGQAIQLVQGEVITIGRSGECTVVFDEEQISARHCEVDWSQNGFSIFDLGSANGTLVNGHRISGRVALRLGAHVQVGSTILQLADIDMETADVELIEKDTPQRGQVLASRGVTVLAAPKMLALSGAKTAMMQKAAELVVDDRSVAAAAKLKDLVAGGGQGAKIVVQREGRLDPFWSVPVTIGREQGSGVVLDDKGVSLRHAVIDHREGRYLIRDVGSSNGTFVNGRRIVEERLADGDIVGVGSYAMLVLLGQGCLGLDLQPPGMTAEARKRGATKTAIGMIKNPLGERAPAPVKRKKKASELIWYATSDLDRGTFRARSAILAMAIGAAITGWMLFSGDSEILAGNRLSAKHESQQFLAQAGERGRDQCTACHVGAGRTSTLRCLDCHPYDRPTPGHAAADVECLGCHIEHRGTEYRPAIHAVLDCKRCHEKPHVKLARVAPKLVETFEIDAVADVEFHLTHEDEGVACLRCHDPSTHSKARGIRGACGQCHAPNDPAADECQLCHPIHPDRARTSTVVAELPPIEPPPKFAARSLLWAGGMLVLSFLLAAVIPRKRRVSDQADVAADIDQR